MAPPPSYRILLDPPMVKRREGYEDPCVGCCCRCIAEICQTRMRSPCCMGEVAACTGRYQEHAHLPYLLNANNHPYPWAGVARRGA